MPPCLISESRRRGRGNDCCASPSSITRASFADVKLIATLLQTGFAYSIHEKQYCWRDVTKRQPTMAWIGSQCHVLLANLLNTVSIDKTVELSITYQ